MSEQIDDGGPETDRIHPGMTLRDWFAGQVLSSINGKERDEDFDTMPGIAAYCYIIADAMIEKRKMLDTKEKEE